MAKYIFLVFALAVAISFQKIIDHDMEPNALFYLGSFDGKSYFAENSLMNWTAAQDFCKDTDMQLATITSKEQLQFLNDSYSENFSWAYWLNGRDALDASQFVWDHDNSSVDSSFITLENLPYHRNCLYYWADVNLGELGVNTASCTGGGELYVLCEAFHY